MFWTKVIVFSCLLWLRISGQIIIYPLSRDTIVTPPRDMTLGCENTGKTNITWTIPDNSDWAFTNIDTRVLNLNNEEEVIPKYNSRTQDQINISYELIEDLTSKKLNNASLLVLSNFTYHDIGYYYCHEIGARFDDEQRSNKIFVYLNDEEKLSFLARDKIYILNVKQNIENITFPCIPTNPNITVTLTAFSSSVERNYFEMSSDFSTYHPEEGYNVKITEVNSIDFVCEFKRNKKKEKIFFHLQHDFFDYNVQPFIDSPNFIESFSGQNLKLTCNIVFDNGNWSSLIWITPNNNTKVQIENVTFPMTNGRFKTSVLYVERLTVEDSGEYICKINNTKIKGSVAKIFLSIDSEPKFKKPKITPNYKALQLNPSVNLTLICEANQEIIWASTSKLAMKNDKCDNPKSKYKFKKCYTITNAAYYDTKYYYCHVVNAAKEDKFLSEKIFIFVRDMIHLNSNPLPVLKIKTTEYSNVTIPCIPTAPDVNVTLTDGKKTQIPVQRYNSMNGFTIITKKDDIVNLECVFERENKNETQKVILDVRRSYKYEFEPNLSTVDDTHSFTGGDLVLICSVIVRPDFKPNILWATPNEPEFFENQTLSINNSSYMIANGKIVVSSVTVKYVQLGDFRQYECSLKDDRNKTRFVRKVLILNFEFNIKPHIETERQVALDDTIEAKCLVRADHNIRFKIKWIIPGNINDTRTNVTESIYKTDVFGILGSNILIRKNIKFEDQGNYTCKVTDHLNNTNEETVYIEIKEPVFPKIYSTHNMENNTVIFKIGSSIDLQCYIQTEDLPKPNIVWYKDNKIIANDIKQEISITYALINDSGVYSCNVSNRLGTTSQWVNIIVPSDELTTGIKIIIGLLSLLIFGFIILTAIFTYRCIKEMQFKRKIKSSGIAKFGEGQILNLNPDISISDQVELLPYNKKWEIPRERVKLGKKLGSGQFGVVYKGEVFGVFPGETIKTVAIKTVHRNTDFHGIKALVNELKIITYIGKHVNVVNLCGACTRNIEKKEILIITEFCHFGNLRDYLLTHREYFINQIDPETGLIDIDNIDPTQYECNIPSEEELSKYMNPYSNLEEIPYKGTWSIFKKSHYKLKVNKNHEYGNIRIAEKEQKYISTHDLLCWSFQVARGMEYISTRRILHGDLAARNVLLTTNNIVKICDFGLSKNMYKYKNYKKKSKSPLPVKWMAIESIRDRVFSSKSDVWSFGITLWEFFSLGSIPYPGMEPSSNFVKKLEEGYRMAQPEYATSDIYQIMINCWENKAADRPDFSKLVEVLGILIHNNVQKHYVDLNKPYEDLNITENCLELISNPNYKNRQFDKIKELEDNENIEEIELEDFNLKREAEKEYNEENFVQSEIQNKKDDTRKDFDQVSTSSPNIQIRKRIKNIEVEVHRSMM